MALPRNRDNSINWQRIKFQDKEFWHLTDEEWRTQLLPDSIAAQANIGEDPDEPTGPLIEKKDLDNFASYGSVNGQLKMMFDDIQHKHHPEGFEGDIDAEF